MKLKDLFLTSLFFVATTISFTSCSDDDNVLNDLGSKVELPQNRVFFLNEGSNGANNSNILFYNPIDGKTLSSIFASQNNAMLGDTGQDMIEYNGNIYVSVYQSNYLTKLNAACVEQKKISFLEDEDLKTGIRFIAAEGGYIYASFYGGVVAKIDANTLEVIDKIKNLGKNLENVAICNNTLYVSNSYHNDGLNYIYDKEVFAIDLRSFKLKETITVTQNPNEIMENSNKVFVISHDYSQESYELQMIDASDNNKVSKIGFATSMAANGGIIYLIDSRTDWKTYLTTNTFSTYNIKTNKLEAKTFLKDAPTELSSSSIYMMKVNPHNGDIYIGVTFFSASNGTIYRFDKSGKFIGKFDCGGQNPKTAVFFN